MTADNHHNRVSSPWQKSLRKLRRDHWGLMALAVVAGYALIAIGVAFGWWGQDWSSIAGPSWSPPSPDHWFGTNLIGQDIFERALYSTRTAYEIGLIVAISSTLIGAVLGVISGFYAGSWIDDLILWQMGVLDAMPFYLFVAAVAYALAGSAWAMHIAMIATFWTLTARLVRGEVIKLRSLGFVEAAIATGVPAPVILFRHILPNTSHILLVQGTIIFVSAIKAEVILSFLGLGVQDGTSWGLMIAESAQEVLSGQVMNFIVASTMMFILIMAFNLFADSLQDALDPKVVSS
jgi:ABC-type dipeptide/oligopeptide/nickel transport system permease subunit